MLAMTPILVKKNTKIYGEIYRINLIISIKSEVSTFTIVVIFSRGMCLRWLYYHILSSITYISRRHWDLNSIIDVIDVHSMVFAYDRIHYGLQVVFVCLQITPSHYHHYADLSEGIELIKFLLGICCRVCVKDWGNSLEYLSYNIWGCVSSACPILLWWSWECVLYLIIIIKSEVWISNHCLGPGHETIACAVWFTVFLCVLIKHTPSTCYWQFSSKWLLATSFAK